MGISNSTEMDDATNAEMDDITNTEMDDAALCALDGDFIELCKMFESNNHFYTDDKKNELRDECWENLVKYSVYSTDPYYENEEIRYALDNYGDIYKIIEIDCNENIKRYSCRGTVIVNSELNDMYSMVDTMID